MNFEQALQETIKEGAIRFYQLSDNLAYVYRYNEGRFEARGLYGHEGKWKLGARLVSIKDYSDRGGWHPVGHLPWQVEVIDDLQARENPGYGIAMLRQCYTCKEMKAPEHFSRQGNKLRSAREWECDECYARRTRELAHFKNTSASRKGDALSKATLSSPTPPASEI